jgi:sRNA-binding regulator protein Hfq
MVKYWRKNAIKIVLYLVNGFGMSDSFGECKKDSFFVDLTKGQNLKL